MSTAVADFEVVVESGIPVPERKSLRSFAKKRESKYPVSKLEVGQSFWVPKAKSLSARGTASRFKKQNPEWGYTVRVEGRTNAEGVVESGVRDYRLK